MPQWVVSDVLCTPEDGLGICGAQCEGRAVGELDQLGECVGPLWASQECRVANLLGLAGVWGDGGAEGTQGAG